MQIQIINTLTSTQIEISHQPSEANIKQQAFLISDKLHSVLDTSAAVELPANGSIPQFEHVAFGLFSTIWIAWRSSEASFPAHYLWKVDNH